MTQSNRPGDALHLLSSGWRRLAAAGSRQPLAAASRRSARLGAGDRWGGVGSPASARGAFGRAVSARGVSVRGDGVGQPPSGVGSGFVVRPPRSPPGPENGRGPTPPGPRAAAAGPDLARRSVGSSGRSRRLVGRVGRRGRGRPAGAAVRGGRSCCCGPSDRTSVFVRARGLRHGPSRAGRSGRDTAQHEEGAMDRRIRVRVSRRPAAPRGQEIDRRTPSGRILPY